MVGALSPSLNGNSATGTGKLFVLEGDEYPSANWDASSKFLHYNTDHLLLTSCEHDHFNIFPTVEEYLKPFQQLVSQPRLSSIVACLDGSNVVTVLQKAAAPITYYSATNSSAEWYATNIRLQGQATEFTLMRAGKQVMLVTTQLLGAHNIQNIVGVSAFLLRNQTVSESELQAGIASFLGVRRRLELKTPVGQVPLYEDFGSSRAKLKAGIFAVRQHYPDRKLHVIFEPHTFSFRSRAALPWYDDLFTEADAVYVFQPHMHGASTHEQLDQTEIVTRITASGVMAQGFSTKEQLPELLGSLSPLKDTVLIETSGEIGGAIPYLTKYLASLTSA